MFPIVSLSELVTPWVGPFLTLGTWLAGCIKRTTIHCYTQNMKALGLLVSEKSFYGFLIVSLWELMTPGAGPFLTPRGMVGRINKEDPYTLLHTNMKALGIAASEKIVLCFSHKAPGARSVWTPGAWLAGFIKKKIFCYVFLIVSLWELSFGLETRVLI